MALYPEMSLIPDGILTLFGLGDEYTDEFTFYRDGTLAIDMKNGRSLVGIVYGNVMSPNDIVESTDWDRGRWLVGAQYYNEDVDNEDNSLNWFNDPVFIGFDPNCGVSCGHCTGGGTCDTNAGACVHPRHDPPDCLGLGPHYEGARP